MALRRGTRTLRLTEDQHHQLIGWLAMLPQEVEQLILDAGGDLEKAEPWMVRFREKVERVFPLIAG